LLKKADAVNEMDQRLKVSGLFEALDQDVRRTTIHIERQPLRTLSAWL